MFKTTVQLIDFCVKLKEILACIELQKLKEQQYRIFLRLFGIKWQLTLVFLHLMLFFLIFLRFCQLFRLIIFVHLLRNIFQSAIKLVVINFSLRRRVFLKNLSYFTFIQIPFWLTYGLLIFHNDIRFVGFTTFNFTTTKICNQIRDIYFQIILFFFDIFRFVIPYSLSYKLLNCQLVVHSCILLSLHVFFLSLSIQRYIFAEHHKLMQIHGFSFDRNITEMFVFHFLWIEPAIVRVNQIEVYVYYAVLFAFLHYILLEESNLISNAQSIDLICYISDFILLGDFMNNLSSKTKIGKLFNPYPNDKPEKESEENGKGSGSKKKIQEEKGFVFSLSQFQQKNRSSRGTNNGKVENNLNSSIQRQKQTSIEQEEEQSKRKMIYGSESYKEKYEQDFPKAVENNNDLFSMVFLGKSKPNETTSTTTSNSFNKGKPLSSGKIEAPPPAFDETGNLKVTDFQLGRKLGAGKFGQVFIARHKATGFMCALKKIDKTNVDSKLVVQLVREIKIQSFLNHPNIVKMYSFFADKNFIYLVLQLCFSGQLYNFLKKKRKVAQDMTKNIVQQICRALDYMHENQIIHRDLKPENVIYHCGLLKLCDFGWSISTNTMRGTFCGTPLYVSPQLLKRKTYNNKIDVWSVGILTYELLFGRVPFEITTEQDFMKIVEDEIKFSKATKISEQAKDFILICLEKDPRDRFTLPELLEHPFLTHVENVSMVEMY